jgi:hypothetical protein
MSMDWTTSYQALTSKAASSYQRLLTHWQELLGKMSRGELAPNAIQDRLPQFFQDQSQGFYRRLTALSFDFLKGLSEVQGDCTEDFIRGLLGDSFAGPPSRPSPPSPPLGSADVNEWTRWYQTVTTQMAEQSQSALARYQSLLERVASGRITPASIQDYARKFATDRTLLLSRDAAELQLKFFEGLLQLNQDFADDLFGHLAGDLSSGANGSIESVSLDLIGRADSTVAASLTVENTAARTSEVYCAISEFRKADGTGLTFRAPLEVEPIEFSLNPGETRSVALRLHLSPEIFAPNQNYTGTLIINQNKQSILVLLTARATAAKPEKAKASVVTAAPERPLLVTAVRPRRTGRKTRKNPQKKKRNRKGS